MTSRKVSSMNKLAISLAVGMSLALAVAQVVHARGFGGAHGGGFGGGPGGGMQHGGAGFGSAGGMQRGGFGGGAGFGGAGGMQRGGPGGGMQRGGFGAGGMDRGGIGGGAGTERGPGGGFGGAGGMPRGGESFGAGSRGSATSHVGLPTDAGFGMAGRGFGTPGVGAPGVGAVGGEAAGAGARGVGAAGFAGYHQTEAVSGSAYAARGAAVRTSYSGAGMFGAGWYAAHPAAWRPAAWTAGRPWAVATWPAVGSWFGWGAATQPVYYDYGNAITYQNNQVYYGDQPVASADQYYQQTSTLAQSQPAGDPNADEWMPLGVFGLVRGDQSDPHFIMQLAVNKSGAVAGNYQDVVSGTTLPVHGAVDQKTQRLAWSVGDNRTTVGETGLYNLTKDEAPALIHIGKDKTQQWTLVRLKQPEAPSGQQ